MNKYIGRFAPSPTGPLHFGSLVAAVASYLDAKAHQGKWLMRMEDLDPPREMPGASDLILKALEAFELHSDAPIIYQSQRHDLYQTVCEQLLDSKQAFYCKCSRSQLKATQGLHLGNCHSKIDYTQPLDAAIRLQAKDLNIEYQDRIQGLQSENILTDVGDFVIKRRDGLFAYQLAMVLDDHLQGITHIVRGSDLMDSSCRQIYLQQELGFIQPSYGHIPVIHNEQGQKLSKQNLAPALDIENPSPQLFKALQALNLHPPKELESAPPTKQLLWARDHWDINNITPVISIEESTILS